LKRAKCPDLRNLLRRLLRFHVATRLDFTAFNLLTGHLPNQVPISELYFHSVQFCIEWKEGTISFVKAKAAADPLPAFRWSWLTNDYLQTKDQRIIQKLYLNIQSYLIVQPVPHPGALLTNPLI